MECDLPRIRPLLLQSGKLLRHLGERLVENRDAVFDAEIDLGIVRERLLPRLVEVRCLQGDRLVAVRVGELDAAIPALVPHVGSAEDDEAALQLFGVDLEPHDGCPSVYVLCIFEP